MAEACPGTFDPLASTLAHYSRIPRSRNTGRLITLTLPVCVLRILQDHPQVCYRRPNLCESCTRIRVFDVSDTTAPQIANFCVDRGPRTLGMPPSGLCAVEDFKRDRSPVRTIGEHSTSRPIPFVLKNTSLQLDQGPIFVGPRYHAQEAAHITVLQLPHET